MNEQPCTCGNVGRISYGEDYRPIRECSCGGTVTHGEWVARKEKQVKKREKKGKQGE